MAGIEEVSNRRVEVHAGQAQQGAEGAKAAERKVEQVHEEGTTEGGAPQTGKVAASCVIANVKLGTCVETNSEDEQAETPTREPSSVGCAEVPVDESGDDDITKELKVAEMKLAEPSPTQTEGVTQHHPSGEQHEAAEKLPVKVAPQAYQPPVMGQAGWEKDPDRPPQKLPIRFRDCVGRNIMIPWKVAKSAQGVKNLIDSIFVHVDVLAPHVLAGRYDLVAHNVWTTADTAAVSPALLSFQHVAPQNADSPVPAPVPTAVDAAATAPWATAPSAPEPPGLVGSLASIILPELWEDIVEPGMMITMQMWPMAVVNPPVPAGPVVVGGTAPPPPPPSWSWQPPRRPSRRAAAPPPRRKTRKRQG